MALVNAQIDGFNQELQKLVSSAKEQDKQEILGSDIVKKKRELELNIHDAQRRLRAIKEKRREQTDRLGNKLETGQHGGGAGRDHGRRRGPGNLAERPKTALHQPRQRRIGIYYLLFVIYD